ncbi:MAG: 3-oxoacid CoA-transferase subunit B [Myxococcota bacterium]
MSWTKEQMAQRALSEIPAGAVVNLGIGLPTLVADVMGDDADVWLQSENGLLGMGPYPLAGEEDPQLINAGKEVVTLREGASTFDSATSFAMIRGGHVDVAIMGAMQVAATGDLANWSIPGGRTTGIGGAMDLAAGAKRVVVLMRHAAKNGSAKLLSHCSFPLTARRVVRRVITDLGVFDPAGATFRVVELAPGVSLEAVADVTDAPLRG